MNRTRRFLWIAAVSLLAVESAWSQPFFSRQNPVVGKVNGESVRYGELAAFFERNYPSDTLSAEKLRDFLPTYLLYRAKVSEGLALSLDQDSAFAAELSGFSEKAAPSYWIENELRESLLQEYIERSREEIKASHVLVRLEANASVRDTARAWDRIMEARDRFLAGATMDSLNEVYSSMVQGRAIGGPIPWFSAGTTVYEFEDAAYALQPGEVSMPVRTQFGYHLIHLEGRRPRSPRRMASHIFFRNREDSVTAARVDSAVAALEAGQPWAEVADSFSEDRASATNGGSIGWVTFDLKFNEEFTEMIMDADPQAEWSGPLESVYGIHLVRIDSVEALPDSATLRAQLDDELRQNPRYRLDEEDVLERIRESVHVEEYRAPLQALTEAFLADTVVYDSLQLPSSLLDQVLLRVHGDDGTGAEYTGDDYLFWIQDRAGERSAEEYRVEWYDGFVKDMIRMHVIDITAEVFPEFAASIEQFRNGLMVFRLNEMNIWDPAYIDSAAIRAQYERTPDAYRYDTRYAYTIFSSRNDSLLEAVSGQWDSIRATGVSIDTLRQRYAGVVFLQDSSEAVDTEPWNMLPEMRPGEVSETFDFRSIPSKLGLDAILPPRAMTFDEAYYRAFSDLQPTLEADYHASLRERYGIREYPKRIR